jgi:AraC-like DNA-binding protein
VRAITLLKQTEVNVRDIFSRAQVPGSPDAFLSEGFRSLESERLHQLSAHATTVLASLANSQDGRPPIRGDDWGMLLYCLISSRTLREVIVRCSRFYAMLDERWGRLSLHVHAATAEIRMESLRVRRNVVAFVVDSTGIAVLHGMFSWLIGHTIPLSMILLDYDEAMRPNFDFVLLPYPLTLGADAAAFRFPAEYLDYPVVRTVEDYEQRVGQSFLFDLHEDHAGASVAEQARRLMYAALREHRALPMLEELSEQLNSTVPTLRRNLARAGTSYNHIKDSCRRELALDLLRRSTLSIEEISMRLGFCDSDAFRRAFREWMNMSPLKYRKTGGMR